MDLKVCHISSMHEAHDDRVFERACKGLAKKGCQVEMIVTHSQDQLKDGVNILALHSRSGWRRRLWSSREAYLKACRSDAQIFHFHDPDMLPWMVRLSMKGRKVVYDVHENYTSRMQNLPLPGFLKSLLAKGFRWYEKRCIRKFSGVVVVSDSMRDLFADAHDRIETIQNVPDLNVLGDLDLNGSHLSLPIIYTSGTHSDARNCRQAVAALKGIIKRHPRASMEFVGRYVPMHFPEILKGIARADGASEALKLQGMVPWLENFHRTSKAYMGCVFYEDNPNNKVGIPNRLFEYMYCGIPVLAEDFPELRKIVAETECGLLVDSSKPQSITDAANKLLDSPQLAGTLGANGRKAVLNKYNFNTQLESMLAFYKDIIQS